MWGCLHLQYFSADLFRGNYLIVVVEKDDHQSPTKLLHKRLKNSETYIPRFRMYWNHRPFEWGGYWSGSLLPDDPGPPKVSFLWHFLQSVIDAPLRDLCTNKADTIKLECWCTRKNLTTCQQDVFTTGLWQAYQQVGTMLSFYEVAIRLALTTC
jgi:hypothetical protein